MTQTQIAKSANGTSDKPGCNSSLEIELTTGSLETSFYEVSKRSKGVKKLHLTTFGNEFHHKQERLQDLQ